MGWSTVCLFCFLLFVSFWFSTSKLGVGAQIFAQDNVGNHQYSYPRSSREACRSLGPGQSTRRQISREKSGCLEKPGDNEDTEERVVLGEKQAASVGVGSCWGVEERGEPSENAGGREQPVGPELNQVLKSCFSRQKL